MNFTSHLIKITVAAMAITFSPLAAHAQAIKTLPLDDQTVYTSKLAPIRSRLWFFRSLSPRWKAATSPTILGPERRYCSLITRVTASFPSGL